jgi:hypothetical protein
MSKSSPRRGFGRRSGTVTVIEQKVYRSSQRNARFAFVITAVTAGLVTLVVAKDHMHPILALLVAAPVALLIGGIVWTLVRIWPVLRLLWWWTPEIGGTVLLAYGWTQLAEHTISWVTLAVLALVVGVPAVLAPIRRHVGFSQFIVANKSGSLPLIFGAWPTPVGERVWAMLRPGLSLSYLQGQLDKITVACHADAVLVEKARSGDSAFVRFDIKRREVLTAQVNSPPVDLIDPDTPLGDKEPATVTGLDFTDVPDDPAPMATATKPAASRTKPSASSATAPADDDVSEWI